MTLEGTGLRPSRSQPVLSVPRAMGLGRAAINTCAFMPDLNGCSNKMQLGFPGPELLFRVLFSLWDLQIPLCHSESVPGCPEHIRSLWLPYSQPQTSQPQELGWPVPSCSLGR